MRHKHLTEEQLEKIALQFNNTNNEEIDNTGLQSCDYCKNRLQLLIDFYNQLDENISEPAFGKVDKLAKSLSDTNRISLEYFRASVDSSLPEEKRMIVLAAAHRQDDNSRFATIGTYASEPDQILIRVLEDRSEKTFNIFILSENQQYSCNIILLVTDINDMIHSIAANAEGTAMLSGDVEIDWKNTKIIILIPLGETNFKKIKGTGEEFPEKKFRVKLSSQEGSTVLEINSSHSLNRALLIYTNREPVIKNLISGKLILDDKDGNELETIRFFS